MTTTERARARDEYRATARSFEILRGIEIFVGVGSNIEPETNLRFAVKELERRFGKLRCSDVFQSPAFGFCGADFLNMVIAFTADTAVDDIECGLSSIEYAGGRTRQAERYVPRTLDLDLLLYGAYVDATRRLPRDDVLRFPFVLGPLAELAPQVEHPITGIEFADAWHGMKARGVVLERIGPVGDLG